MFKATLSDPSLIIDPLVSIAEIIDEGIFKISANGMKLVAADRAMVAAVDFNLSKGAFEEFEVDSDQAIGLNISNILSVLKRASSKNKVKFNLDGNKLKVEITNGSTRRFVVPLIDVTQEEIPQIDQLEFASTAEVKADVLQSGVDDAEIVSDHVFFQTNSGKFVLRSEGDLSSSELELESGNSNLISLSSPSETGSRYPLDYLKKMLKAAAMADTVTVQFGQDYPMKLSFKSGDKASLQFVLAPRIADNE